MSDITDISTAFKNDQIFVEAQHKTISTLISKNKLLEEEIAQLKQLLINNHFNETQKIILTPEQALIDGQIDILQQRSYLQELSLEDVKKLDLLLKNKFLIKRDNPETLDGKAKPVKLSNARLLEIASQHESK